MYRLTLSRPGQPPYLTVFERAAGFYGPAEIAPLGGRVEVLRGGFPGTGEIRLSRPPPALPGDWLRVWLPDDAEDDPTYLGEVADEVWAEGEGTLSLRPLAESVSRAAWDGFNSGTFAAYLTAVFTRAELAPGLSIGDITDSPATLQANTLFELIGDTMNAAMPVIELGTWGVTGQAEICVRAPSSEVTHRFVNGQDNTPPGQGTAYANCTRFSYALPSGLLGWFKGRIEPEVLARGEVWDTTQIPASILAQTRNPDAAVSATIRRRIMFPAGGGFATYSDVVRPVFDPTWTGKLDDGLPALGTVFGVSLPGAAGGDEAKTLHPVPGVVDGLGANYSIAVSGVPDAAPGSPESKLRVVVSTEGAAATPLPIQLSAAKTHVLTYDATDVAAFHAAFGIYPHGFQISTGWASNIDRAAAFETTVMVALGADTSVRLPLRVHQTVTGTAAAANVFATPNIPALFSVENSAQIISPTARQWRIGETINTNFSASEVSVPLPDDARLVLVNKASIEAGRKLWEFGLDMLTDTLTVKGSLSEIGWIGATVRDEAALAAYAAALLRYKSQPVRVWTGHYEGLTRRAAFGVAVFTVAGQDVGLDVQRVTYDLENKDTTVECGTPLPREQETFGVILDNLKREIRSASQ